MDTESNRMDREPSHTPAPNRDAPVNRLRDTANAEAAAEWEFALAHISASEKQLVAQQLGYDSFESLLASSTILTLSDGSKWWVTADRHGSWTAWNLCSIRPSAAGALGSAASN